MIIQHRLNLLLYLELLEFILHKYQNRSLIFLCRFNSSFPKKKFRIFEKVLKLNNIEGNYHKIIETPFFIIFERFFLFLVCVKSFLLVILDLLI